MKKYRLLAILASGLVIAACSSQSISRSSGVEFTQRVNVFGVQIKATDSVSPEALLHAANVMAQYIDNNEDGRADNPAVLKSMLEKRATLLMAEVPEDFEYLDERTIGSGYAQDLYEDEVYPDGIAEQRFDATLEEVWHLISFAGYESVYPDTFGVWPGSAMTKAMDVARGGYFRRVPRNYPASSWYSYYDTSCDYECQAGEYFYWGLTTMLGAHNYSWRKAEIADEWRLTTPESFASTDRAMYALLKDPKYKFPKKLPDGRYRAFNLTIDSIEND